MQLTPQAKSKLVAQFPELRDWLEQRQTNELLTGLFSQIKMMKGDKGDKGEAGYTPVKGQDYFTDAEVRQICDYILSIATPKKGVHYNDGEKGDSYILTAKDKKEIANSIDVPVVEKIIEKTEVIKEVPILEKESIDVSVIKGAVSKKELDEKHKKVLDGMAVVQGRIKLIDQRWGGHGGGLKTVSHDTTLSGDGTPSSPLSVIGGGGGGAILTFSEITSPVINGINVTYTLAVNPSGSTLLTLVDSSEEGIITYLEGISYTRSGSTITMNNPIDASYSGYRLILGYGAASSGITFVDNEIVSGSGTSFTLANTPATGSLNLFGSRNYLYPTTDYTISGATITTVSSWSAGDLIANYRI